MRKVSRRRIREQRDGVNVVGDIHGVVVTNAAEPGLRTRSSSRSSVRIVQRDGKTEIHESYEHDGHG